jgi:hypothetical protein
VPRKGQFFWLWLKKAQNWPKLKKAQISQLKKAQNLFLKQIGSNFFI